MMRRCRSRRRSRSPRSCDRMTCAARRQTLDAHASDEDEDFRRMKASFCYLWSCYLAPRPHVARMANSQAAAVRPRDARARARTVGPRCLLNHRAPHLRRGEIGKKRRGAASPCVLRAGTEAGVVLGTRGPVPWQRSVLERVSRRSPRCAMPWRQGGGAPSTVSSHRAAAAREISSTCRPLQISRVSGACAAT